METLFGLALKSLLIAGATLALLHFTRNRSAADRSWIAHLGLFALVALPLASLALPALHVAMPDALTPAVAEVAAPATAAPATLDLTDQAVTVTAPVAASAASAPAFDWSPYAYAAPAIALLLITLVALLRLFALRHRAQVLVDPTWLSALAHAQRRMGFKNGTALLTSNELSSPISWGLMRPVILLNDEALAASGEAEAIIAHELAHVARLDWAKLMLARVATAIFWFNPLAWLLAREAHQLREEAADDAVLAANIAGPDYAQLLVGVARHECKGMLLGAHGISPGKDSLRRRVSRVLDGSLARGPGGRSWVAGFAAGMLVMAAPLAALTFAPKEKLPADSLIGAKFAEGKPLVSVAASTPGAEPSPMLGGIIASAVTASVAAVTGIHPEIDVSDIEEAARDAEIDAEQAREDARDAIDDARDARREAKRGKKSAVDQAIEMKMLGITPEYAASLRNLGGQFRNLDTDDLMELKVKGVTAQYVRGLAAAGYGHESIDRIGDAAIMGVTPAFAREVNAASYQLLTLDDLTDLKTMGVTADYIQQFRRAGYANLTAKQLVKMRNKGVRPDDLPGPPPPRTPPPPPPVQP